MLLCETETVLKSEISSSLKLSNIAGWKNSLEFLWCRYNSIPLCGTQLSILRLDLGMVPKTNAKSAKNSRKMPQIIKALQDGFEPSQ